MTDLVALQKANDRRWAAAHITRSGAFSKKAATIVANKQRYIDIVRRCRALGSNMPDDAWVFVAVIHNRESSLDFNTHLGQGDPLRDGNGRAIKTVHVPAGRGPFTGPDAFEKAAVDALVYCAPRAAMANKDWSISGMLTYLERYNGLAYANAGVPSPYIWAGTDQYKSGKVLVDHGPIVWGVTDQQLGCAGLLLAISALDSSTHFDAQLPVVTAPSIVADPTDSVLDTYWLQDALNRLGATPQLLVDGIYGGGTRNAVRAFQRSHKLHVDGKAGMVETIPAIKAELKKAKLSLFPVKEKA